MEVALATAETAAPLIPERLSLKALREVAAGCTACPLHRKATRRSSAPGSSASR